MKKWIFLLSCKLGLASVLAMTLAGCAHKSKTAEKTTETKPIVVGRAVSSARPASNTCETVKKDGFSVYVADSNPHAHFEKPKVFKGQKYFSTRSSVITDKEIFDIGFKNDAFVVQAKPIRPAAKYWLLVRQELVYGVAPVKKNKSAEQIEFAELDQRGLASLCR
jgi:hypothetical protein